MYNVSKRLTGEAGVERNNSFEAEGTLYLIRFKSLHNLEIQRNSFLKFVFSREREGEKERVWEREKDLKKSVIKRSRPS